MSGIISGIAAGFNKMPWFNIVTGFATVFVGLICIVILCKIIGLFCRGAAKKEAEQLQSAEAGGTSGNVENRQEIIAAVTAVCAEHMGKDIKALRVVSFKKI